MKTGVEDDEEIKETQEEDDIKSNERKSVFNPLTFNHIILTFNNPEE